METIITVDKVYKSFGKGDLEVKVLEGADLTIRKGEFVSLMGPSGSGKSTLLYLIGGLDRIYTGDIVVCGNNIGKLKENKLSDLRLGKIGFIFQFYNLVQNLTVEDNILLPLKVAGKYNEDTKKKLNEILDITELTDKGKAMPAKLSGGQQQRVAIARALIGEPEIILADEPTGNLDKASGENIMDLFGRINKENGMTILQVTHSEKNSEYGSRIVRLDNGKLIG
ncbi:MAG: ABC transporter ATP-binding protein [Clostridiales bacterium]|nr:ABC transporter ATP-binding protein [Clostridiales bacterium]